MVDGNLAALNDYMARIDAEEDAFRSFVEDIDEDLLIERAIEHQGKDIVEFLFKNPNAEGHQEAIKALAKYALYQGQEFHKAYAEVVECIQKCDFFDWILDNECEAMYEEWKYEDHQPDEE